MVYFLIFPLFLNIFQGLKFEFTTIWLKSSKSDFGFVSLRLTISGLGVSCRVNLII